MRLDLMPTMDQVKERRFTVEDVKDEIRISGRSGCFRDLIYQARFKVNVKDGIWVKREVASDYYDGVAKGYENFSSTPEEVE